MAKGRARAVEDDVKKSWIEEAMRAKPSLEMMSDVELFAKMQDMFMFATGLNANVLNAAGEPLIPDVHRYPDFCRLVQSVPEGCARCKCSDLQVTRQAIRRNRAVVRRCHAGLYDGAVPIRFHRYGVGAFITGQVLLKPLTKKTKEEITRRVADLGLDPEALSKAIDRIPRLSRERIMAIMEFMKVLADYIVKSIQEVEFNRREAELQYLLRETEMKMIHSRIHPHFLFNVLNLIAGQALLENAPRTHAYVVYLSEMLRYMVHSYRPVVTIAEELKYLDSYVRLQCLRFENRLKYEAEVDDEAREACIPSLTLQILIENAIHHGVEPKEGRCFIRLRIVRKEDRVIVKIRDDGVGIDEKKLNEIAEPTGDFARRLSGLTMIRKRMEFYFRQAYRLKIESIKNGGTSVTLSFPFATSLSGLPS